MIFRRSSQGYQIAIYKNTTPGAKRTKTYADGAVESVTYPTSGYDYFVAVDGEVVKESNSLKTVEEYYVNECAKKYDNGHGRLIVGRHHLINNVATSQSDYPTESNTKSEIKSFYDVRKVPYDLNETKSELLSRIVDMKSGNNSVSKHLK